MANATGDEKVRGLERELRGLVDGLLSGLIADARDALPFVRAVLRTEPDVDVVFDRLYRVFWEAQEGPEKLKALREARERKVNLRQVALERATQVAALRAVKATESAYFELLSENKQEPTLVSSKAYPILPEFGVIGEGSAEGVFYSPANKQIFRHDVIPDSNGVRRLSGKLVARECFDSLLAAYEGDDRACLLYGCIEVAAHRDTLYLSPWILARCLEAARKHLDTRALGPEEAAHPSLRVYVPPRLDPLMNEAAIVPSEIVPVLSSERAWIYLWHDLAGDEIGCVVIPKLRRSWVCVHPSDPLDSPTGIAMHRAGRFELYVNTAVFPDALAVLGYVDAMDAKDAIDEGARKGLYVLEGN